MIKFKMFVWMLLLLVIGSIVGCKEDEKTDEPKVIMEKHIIDPTDEEYGYYLTAPPTTEDVKACLLLLPGFGQIQENVFAETNFQKHAAKHGILTIAFASRTRLSADSVVAKKINSVLLHAKEIYKIDSNKIILGGFSQGGVVALRFAELCKEFPEQFPFDPLGVFMADSPVDIYLSSRFLDDNLKNEYSEVAVNEAKWVRKFHKKHYGATPSEDPDRFRSLSPFSIDPTLGEHERFLKDVAIRAYHDVDISWRLVNRNQSVKFDNFVATSELINRLLLMGNTKAEFIQTFETGYRKNGDRHPHSWSIVDEKECVEWIEKML